MYGGVREGMGFAFSPAATVLNPSLVQKTRQTEEEIQLP